MKDQSITSRSRLHGDHTKRRDRNAAEGRGDGAGNTYILATNVVVDFLVALAANA